MKIKSKIILSTFSVLLVSSNLTWAKPLSYIKKIRAYDHPTYFENASRDTSLESDLDIFAIFRIEDISRSDAQTLANNVYSIMVLTENGESGSKMDGLLLVSKRLEASFKASVKDELPRLKLKKLDKKAADRNFREFASIGTIVRADVIHEMSKDYKK